MHGLKIIIAAAATAALAGCVQPGPSVVEAKDPSVTYRFDGTQQQFLNTGDQADDYCADFGRRAELDQTYRSGRDHFAVYSCR